MRDVLRFDTLNGAKVLRLGSKVGSLTLGKEADIIILDAKCHYGNSSQGAWAA